MGIVVQKYGGSSVADAAKLRRVAERIVARKRQGTDMVVVVSAMGDTTDRLLSMAREVSAEPARRELDMLLTVGERTTTALLSMAIQALGEEAISFTGSQCGILTTDSHSRARIMEVRPFRVQDELEKGRVVIVAGYQGTSYKREITTLGRGGTDLTAVALAAALGADACEIYSDVDGVLSADPRVVPSAVKLEELSYDEMELMARAGAKVLHRDAVAWAGRAGVALYSRSTFAPETATGTVVRVNPAPRITAVAAVTGRKDLVGVEAGASAIEAVEALLVDVPLVARKADEDSSEWLIAREDLVEADSLCEALEGAGAFVTRSLGSVTVVGSGLGEDKTGYPVIRDTLAPYPNLLGTRGWTAWVPVERVDELVRQLHAELIEAGQDEDPD